MQEMWVQSVDWEDPLEEEMATHSSILPWKNLIDRGDWQATAHRVAKSWTWLSTCFFVFLPCIYPSMVRDSKEILHNKAFTLNIDICKLKLLPGSALVSIPPVSSLSGSLLPHFISPPPDWWQTHRDQPALYSNSRLGSREEGPVLVDSKTSLPEYVHYSIPVNQIWLSPTLPSTILWQNTVLSRRPISHSAFPTFYVSSHFKHNSGKKQIGFQSWFTKMLALLETLHHRR